MNPVEIDIFAMMTIPSELKV